MKIAKYCEDLQCSLTAGVLHKIVLKTKLKGRLIIHQLIFNKHSHVIPLWLLLYI